MVFSKLISVPLSHSRVYVYVYADAIALRDRVSCEGAKSLSYKTSYPALHALYSEDERGRITLYGLYALSYGNACKQILCSIYLKHSLRKVESKTIVLGLNLHALFDISCVTTQA